MFGVHFLFGIFGNITGLTLFLVPVITFWKILKMKSTDQFYGIPYVSTLLNCLLSAWYGLPFISPNNILVSTINGTGSVIELCYVIVLLFYIRDKKYRNFFDIRRPFTCNWWPFTYGCCHHHRSTWRWIR